MVDEQITEEVQIELNELIKEYRDLCKEIKSLEKEKDNVKANILIQMKMANIDDYDTDTHSVKYSMVQRKVLDRPMLEKFLETKNTNYEAFVKINQFEMLKVMEKKNIQETNTEDE